LRELATDVPGGLTGEFSFSTFIKLLALMEESRIELRRIAVTFEQAFGKVSLGERLADVLTQATSVHQLTDLARIREEAGDLLCSVLQLCNECNLNPEQLIDQTLSKIGAQAEFNRNLGHTLPTPQLRIAIYAGSFDPPTRSQRHDIELLLQQGFDEVVVCPVVPKSPVDEHVHASPMHRAALVTLGFSGVDRVSIDYDDISLNRYTSPLGLEARHQTRGEIWHVVDAEDVAPTGNERSVIQTQWEGGEKLWSESRLVILAPPSSTIAAGHRPPNSMVVQCPEQQTSPEVRKSVLERRSIAELTMPLVSDYIERHNLFVPYSSQRYANFQVPKPRLKIVADPRNEKSQLVASQYRRYESDDPNLILVLGGDGTMLHTIREHWRLRIPFLGMNTGHLGFLMNERIPTELTELDLVSYTLPLLRVDTEAPSGEQSWGLAFSDVWLERADGQAAWFRLDVDGETRVSKVVGDGMLVATASGSSAYARAMGATPIPLNTPTVTLVGSNIFEPRFWKPMALPDDSLITIASLDRSGKRPVRGYIDGTPIGAVQQISVRRSLTASVEMAFTREFDPSARLLRSLFPPSEGSM